jgi:WD40 repeat protein
MLAETRVSVNETRISLNANDWDTHCSFAVLDMAVSPDGKYLACATDANKHIIYPLHGNEHVKVLVGHTADEYANARIAWLGDASVVSNSQKDPGLYQWDIGSGKVLKRVERAHAKAVRDLAVADDGTLATCSFDKAAKLWSLCV